MNSVLTPCKEANVENDDDVVSSAEKIGNLIVLDDLFEYGDVRSKLVSPVIAALVVVLIVSAAAHYSLLSVPCLFQKKTRLIDMARQCEVVILGSSHAMLGIRPDSMSISSVNLANVSQSLQIDDQILAKVFRQPGAIKLVVVPVSYFSFDYNLTSNPETEFRDPIYSIYMGVRERNDFEAARDLRYWSLVAAYCTKKPFPVLGVRSAFDYPPIDERGWTAACIAKDSEAVGRERVKSHHALMHESLRKRNKQAIEHMVALSRERGARVLLVMTPVSYTYSNAVPRKRLDGELNFLSSLASSGDVRFADYHADARFEKQDFADPDHLSPHGAARFTKILEQEFITPMLSDRAQLQAVGTPDRKPRQTEL